MKRFIVCLLGIMLILCMAACRNKPDERVNTSLTTPASAPASAPAVVDSAAKTEEPGEGDTSEENAMIVEGAPAAENAELEDHEQVDNTSEEESMKLFINDAEVPVIWEENASVAELMEEAAKGDIVVSMSMYGDFEQVGSLGRKYSSSDKQTTTHNGDIVLYSSSNIVMFYGSNSWAYTRLGKIDLPEKEVTALLANGAVTVTLCVND